MLADHVDEGRAAGSGHLKTRFEVLQQFLRFGHGHSVRAQADFVGLFKAQLLQRFFELSNRHARTEFALQSGREHRNHPACPRLDSFRWYPFINLCAIRKPLAEGASRRCTRRTEMHLLVVDSDDAALSSPIVDRAHGAGLACTGAPGPQWRCTDTPAAQRAALTALVRIDVGAAARPTGDGAEGAGMHGRPCPRTSGSFR